MTIEAGAKGSDCDAISTNDQAASGGARGGNGVSTNPINYGSDLVPFNPGVNGKPTSLPIGGVGNPPVTLINGGGGGSTQGGDPVVAQPATVAVEHRFKAANQANRSVTYDPNCPFILVT